MNNEKKSLLEFPCDFPIKVFGQETDEFESIIVAIIRQHLPELAASQVTSRPSKDGKYLALTIMVHVDSQAQLDAIYRDLSANPLVLMAL